MKVLKSYLDGAVVIGWEKGAVMCNVDGTIGGGKYAGYVSGQASIKLAVVDSIEHLAEDELNALIAAHEPAILPFVQMVEGIANSAMEKLG